MESISYNVIIFSSVQQLQLAKDQIQNEYDRLKNDDVEKEKRLREFTMLSDKREQAKQDLKGMKCFRY